MSAVERLAEIEARARGNWPTSEDVATLAAALRAVLAACDEYTDTVGVIFADDIRAEINHALDVTA